MDFLTGRPPIVVVTGLPRSGTSMMMRMIGAGGAPLLVDHKRPPSPDNPAGFFEFEAVKRLATESRFLEQAVGRAVKIVAPLLFSLPPDYVYRVVVMRRTLDEVLASQQVMLERAQGNTGTVRAVGVETGGNQTALLLAFEGILDRLDAWISAQPNVSGLYVEHSEVIASPAQAATRVARFLADMDWATLPDSDLALAGPLRLEEAAMAAVVDPGLHRQNRENRKTGKANPIDPTHNT